MRFSQTQKPPLGTPINFAHPLAKGLVGCWLMNEGAGGKIYDVSGNSHDGTLQGGPLWVPGRTGPALSFDGVDDYVNTVALTDLITNDFTISLWVNARDLSGDRVLYSADTGGTNRFYLLSSATGSGYLKIGLSGWNEEWANSISFGVWEHYVITLDGTAGYIYRAGSEMDSNSSVVVDIPSTNLFIGAHSTPSNFFGGSIDDIRTYNRALSAQEVQQLYINPYAMFEQYPVWRDYAAAGGLSIPVARYHYANVGGL